MNSKLRIIVTGLIAQHPTLGGVTWDYLQYVIGLARLGHDVYYFEDSGEWPYNLDGGASGNDWVAKDCKNNIEHLATIMTRFGLMDKWAYRFPTKSEWFGLSDMKRDSILKSADLLINVSGTIERPENYQHVRCKVYIDSDPVFTQVKLNLGYEYEEFRKRIDIHDVHFSFGECLSQDVPETGHNWRPTRSPIVISEWRTSMPNRNVFTTVMNWTSYKPLFYSHQTYGQKDVEFKRFIELPNKIRPIILEVALSKTQHVNWQTNNENLSPSVLELIRNQTQLQPAGLLTHMGWRVVDPAQACPDLDSYRHYIESSKAEWSVAKNGYVLGQPGWFSCRSACYLAAGKPVVVQDTGFSPVLPVGEGILSFKTMDEAVVAIRDVEDNYRRHSRAARAIAEGYFNSDKILKSLIDEAMNGNDKTIAEGVS